MSTSRAIPALTLAVLLFTSAALAGELVTVRVGEQDTCTITGVTAIEKSTIRFDLSKLPDVKAVKKATFRFWVNLGKRAPLGRHFTVDKWLSPKFDGFKVWQIGKEDAPLSAVYPFTTSVALHEWDVTRAVQDWVTTPATNKGLKANFPIPAASFNPPWQRPYLQIQYEGDAAGRPKQPTGFKAFYRSGQVFMTWKQIPYNGAFFDSTYRVYKHSAPMTAANLKKAELLGEVHKNSQLNYRRTAYSYGGLSSYGRYRQFWSFVKFDAPKHASKNVRIKAHNDQLPKRYNFVIDDSWPKAIQEGKWLTDAKLLGAGNRMPEGPQLSDDTGLYVHTVEKAGKTYFAVTSVIEGFENRRDFAAGNALTEPVAVKVEEARPVLQVVFNSLAQKRGAWRGGFQLRQYAYWGGGKDGLHSTPSTPFIFQVNTPLEFVGFPRAGSPAITLGSIYWPSPLLAYDGPVLPPTLHAPFPSLHCSLNYTGWPHDRTFYYGGKNPADPKSRGGFAFPANLGLRRMPASNFGYHTAVNTGQDPRQATVLPSFENNIIRVIKMFFGEFPMADRNRVLLEGQGSAFLMGIHHPDVIASVSSAQFAPWSAKWNDNQWRLIGKREWDLKNRQGVSIWNWNDPIWYSKKFPKLTWPFISNCQSPNYAKADDLTHWQNMGFPQFYLDLQKEKRGGRWWWCDIGDAPDGKASLVPMNQAYPAFTNVNFGETPQKRWRREPRGSLNGYLSWGPNGGYLRAVRRDQAKYGKALKAMATVDTAERFEMAIRIGGHGLSQNGQDVPPTNAKFGKTDITLWRLQQFKVDPDKTYVWTNVKVATGQLLQSGTIKPDDRDLLTVTCFLVDKDAMGNKLIIQPGDAAPKVDTSIKIGELAYTEYVKQCDNPVLAPTVKLPSTTFKVSEFTLGGRCNADGSITFTGKGGFGLGGCGTTVMIPKAGSYIVSLRMKGTYGVSWPVVIMNIGGRYGHVMPPRIITDTDWATYRWYAKLDAGKLDIKITTPGDYYTAHQLADLRKGRYLHIAHMTVTHVPDADAEKKAAEIRLTPRGIAVPVGLPTQISAAVLNGLGKPMDTPVTWKAEGADIDAQGRLTPTKAGTCTVTASAAGLEQSLSLTASDKLVENFNEASGPLRQGWAASGIGGDPGRWFTPHRGHHMLNSLWHTRRKPGKSVVLWTPSSPAADCQIQADMIISPNVRMPTSGTRGLVIRAKDKDNHYRLEVQRGADVSTVRLVKRIGGVDAVIAQTDKAPGFAPFDWKTNPSSTGFAQNEALTDAKFKAWRLDRLRLAAKGGVLRGWVNGKEVFPGGVKDAAFKAGAVGLYAESPSCFDNVEVRQAR